MAAESGNSDNLHDASASQMLTAVLDKLGEITSAASSGSFVFRGEPKWYQEISSSPYREYKKLLEPFGVDGFDIRNVQEEIIRNAARFAVDLAPLDLLSQLQHYGHPTNLIDFTSDYLIALFLACSSESADDGRVILLDTETNLLFRMRSPANRIKAQKSVFVDPRSGVISPTHMIPHRTCAKTPDSEVPQLLSRHYGADDIRRHTWVHQERECTPKCVRGLSHRRTLFEPREP